MVNSNRIKLYLTINILSKIFIYNRSNVELLIKVNAVIKRINGEHVN